MDDIVRSELMRDETIRWIGQPIPGRIFSPADLFLVPFSLFWLGFSLFWEGAVVAMDAPWFFKLWGVPFVLIGLYLVIGRFFHQSWLRRHTIYAVTDRRVLVIRAAASRNTQAVFLKDLPIVNRRVRMDGTGTIIFGDSYGQTLAAGGFAMRGRYAGAAPMCFQEIPDVDAVYRLLMELREEEGPSSNLHFHAGG